MRTLINEGGDKRYPARPFCEQRRGTLLNAVSFIHLGTQSVQCRDTADMKRNYCIVSARTLQFLPTVNQTIQNLQCCTRAIVDGVTDVFQPRRLAEHLNVPNISITLSYVLYLYQQ